MSYDLLKGLRIIEISAFVAAPLAGLTLARLGAEVIRIDPPGGGIDFNRWPLASDGSSLYWQGLNRAKKSVLLDLKSPAGQQVLAQLLNTHADNGGIVLTNLGAVEWLQFDALKQHRADVILIELTGHHNGGTAVDYTVNAQVGVPAVTGGEADSTPVNHMLPTWDGIAGLTLSTALLAALRARDKTTNGQHLRIALSDVAVGYLGNLGVLAETALSGKSRARQGNHVYGTFGHSLRCKDGRFVMVVAMTRRHWKALISAAKLEADILTIEQQHNLDLYREADRYTARRQIVTLLEAWSQQHNQSEIAKQLTRHGALWGPYQSFDELLADPLLVADNPMMQTLTQPAGTYPVAGSTIRIGGQIEDTISAAPVPGADTQQLLDELDLSASVLHALQQEHT
ncbi:MAG: CoA transferase [Pseudomonadota bacterium]